MTSSVFWDITPCSLVKVNQHFGAHGRSLQGWSVSQEGHHHKASSKQGFNPEYVGDMFLTHVGWLSTDFAALHPEDGTLQQRNMFKTAWVYFHSDRVANHCRHLVPPRTHWQIYMFIWHTQGRSKLRPELVPPSSALEPPTRTCNTVVTLYEFWFLLALPQELSSSVTFRCG
jgi:hypothetical protein